ncbi:uncharacterized protein [Ptychodera flava]|uniref:uncharacterized protein n=1 Tax=Ptychodera flava TaxID=63121 RepID=UPI00396A16CC
MSDNSSTIASMTPVSFAVTTTGAPGGCSSSCDGIIIVTIVLGTLLVISSSALLAVAIVLIKTRRKLADQKAAESKRAETYQDVFSNEDVLQKRSSYIQEREIDDDLTSVGRTTTSSLHSNDDNDKLATNPRTDTAQPIEDDPRRRNNNMANVGGALLNNTVDLTKGLPNKTQSAIDQRDDRKPKLTVQIPQNDDVISEMHPISAIATLDKVIAQFEFDMTELDLRDEEV